jgi:predicted Zn-ribbon and HTH transcriptional regulator
MTAVERHCRACGACFFQPAMAPKAEMCPECYARDAEESAAAAARTEMERLELRFEREVPNG